TRRIVDTLNVKGTVRKMAFAAGGRLLVATGKTITLYQGTPLRPERSYEGIHGDFIRQVPLSPDEAWVGALTADESEAWVSVWKLDESHPWMEMRRDHANQGLAFSRDGKLLAVAAGQGKNGGINLFDLMKKALIRDLPFQDTTRLWFTPDDKRV